MGYYYHDALFRRIASYCEENIFEYDERLRLALGKMDYLREPLQSIDKSLFDDISEAIYDYSIEYDVDVDGVAVEDIIFI